MGMSTTTMRAGQQPSHHANLGINELAAESKRQTINVLAAFLAPQFGCRSFHGQWAECPADGLARSTAAKTERRQRWSVVHKTIQSIRSDLF